ncbi:TPA: 50S ribosomal protein L2 [Patescibacteria group bacterium]|nr:50S ribosomal protein L2 [Patescibacteria group bacterium]
MPVKLYQPTTPGRRHAGILVRPKIKRQDRIKVKSLLQANPFSGGRNNQGKITTRNRGGGVKRLLRLVDFKQDKFDVPARVLTIEYDPSRTAAVALVQYADGEKRYVLAPDDLKLGGQVLSSHKQIPLQLGNRLPLKYIPAGLYIHNVELVPGGGGILARSAGSWMQVLSQDGDWIRVKVPSSEVRLLSKDCLASIGQLSNIDHSNVRLGLAGRRRRKGFKPHVRGKAMNPVDHPHGGGEGHNPIGLKHPKTPWGKPALGVKTRSQTKWTNKFIVARRNRN